MTISAGSRLGPYEILGAIGAGGMGEVWKARDTRLERTVAIKVLPQHLSSSREVRERFEREAKAIAQLSHAHICALYDVGREGETDYLVMELLEGETLSARLAKGALPLEQTLRYGVEIADALDKAHRQGIVHRDLKPGNVMLTKSGVKLLDFGLAKAVAPASGAVALSSLPTREKELTAEGTILGTFQYMAPEQLEGREADTRTDIFAFGAVLYEMATGRKAFAGSSQASLVTAIMSADPAPISSTQPMSPPALDRVVRTCLAKDPEDRWQSAGDIGKELKWIGEGSQAATPAREIVARRGGRGFVWTLAVALAFVSLASLPLAVAHLWHGRAITRPLRLTVLPPEGTMVFGGFAISPDGRLLALACRDGDGSTALWLRAIETGEAAKLPGTQGARWPFWSPDSRHIGFFAPDGLKRIDPGGGLPQPICRLGSGSPRGGTWSKDGVIVFAPSANSTLFRVSAGGGDPAPATKLVDSSGPWFSHQWPSFLPDGRRFLYVASGSSVNRIRSVVCIGSLDGKEPVEVFEAPSLSPVAYAGGRLLFVHEGLFAQDFDPSTGRLTGEASRLSSATGREWGGGVFAPFSAAAGGILVFGANPASWGGFALTWFDRQGKEVLASQRQYRDPSLSPDGRRIAGWVPGEGDPGDLWILDLERNLETRFTFHSTARLNPIWSPDGSRIVFASNQVGGAFQLFEKRSDGAGQEEQILKTGRNDVPTDWSPDGRLIAYEEDDPRTGKRDLWLLPVSGDRKPFPYMQTPFDEFQGQFSPEGKWMAYGSDESGRWEIYVQPVPASGGKWQVSSAGGTQPRWRQDGGELFYLSMDGTITSVAAKLTSPPEFGPPTALFPIRVVQNALGTDEFVPARDGQRFLAANATNAPQGQGSLTVVVNWAAELEKK